VLGRGDDSIAKQALQLTLQSHRERWQSNRTQIWTKNEDRRLHVRRWRHRHKTALWPLEMTSMSDTAHTYSDYSGPRGGIAV